MLLRIKELLSLFALISLFNKSEIETWHILYFLEINLAISDFLEQGGPNKRILGGFLAALVLFLNFIIL